MTVRRLLQRHNGSWYRQSFGDLYSLVYQHRNSEAADREIRALRQWIHLESNWMILDSCCGNGRHLRILLDLGCNGFGFDLSEELIHQAVCHPELIGRVCRGDIRRIPFLFMF